MNWNLKRISWYGLIINLILLFNCSESKKKEKVVIKDDLPILSPKVYNGIDSVYRTIRNFSLINQDNQIVKGTDLLGKIHVAEFFFTSCPSICPIMAKNLLQVHEKFKNEKHFIIVSYTIDPDYDTPDILRGYAKKNEIDTKTWWFLTGSKDTIYSICSEDYLAFAQKDVKAPGGFLHSGFFILVDENGYIRGAFDGTSMAKTEELIENIKILLTQLNERKSS